MDRYKRMYDKEKLTFEAQVIKPKSSTICKITLPSKLCDDYDIQPYDIIKVTISKVLPR